MQTFTPDPNAKELSFFDEENARSLINLVPDYLKHQIRLLWKGEDGYLLGLSEYDLYRECQRKGRAPQAVDNMLRVKFWIEYDRIQGNGDLTMNMSNVLGRYIARETFYKYYVTDHKKLAWLITPPLDYRDAMQECLSFGVSRLRQIFEESKFEEGITPKGLERFLSAFRLLDERVNGVKVTKGLAPAKFLPPAGLVKAEERALIDENVAGEIKKDIDDEIAERRARIARLKASKAAAGGTDDGRA